MKWMKYGRYIARPFFRSCWDGFKSRISNVMLSVVLLLCLAWVLTVGVVLGDLPFDRGLLWFACGLLLISGVTLWRAMAGKNQPRKSSLVSRRSGSSWFIWMVGIPVVLFVGVLGVVGSWVAGVLDLSDVLVLVVALVPLLFVGGMVWSLLLKPKVTKFKPDLLGVEVQAQVLQRLGKPKQPEADAAVWCGSLMQQGLHISVEDRAVVIGPPGTGKTAFLVSQLLLWAASRRSFVCLDIKPEIMGITHEALRKQGYRIVSFNPTAQTGERYNPFDDIDGPEAIGEFAAALIPGEEMKDKVFYESARDFLDAIVSHLRATGGDASLPGIRALVMETSSHQELMQLLLNSPDDDVREIANSLMLAGANQRLIGSVFKTFDAQLRFLRFPRVRDSLRCSDFSLHDLGKSQPVALFLQFEEKERETTADLLAAMMTHVLRFMIVHHEQRSPVLLLLDEIGSAPLVPSLVTKLNTIRSRQLPTWLYFQSLEQMQKYGEKQDEGPNLILGACDLHMVFRLNDNASATWMSERIGVVEREIEARGFAMEGGLNVSHQLTQEPIIWPHELQKLEPGQVVCVYRGLAWRGEATPYFERWPAYKNQRPRANQLRGAVYGGCARQTQVEQGGWQAKAIPSNQSVQDKEGMQR